MKRVVLAEKASVARSLAEALGGYRKEREAWVKGETWITWAVGHLVEERMPEEYDAGLKRWRLETLPFAPAVLRLKVIDARRDRFAAVKRTLEGAELVVNACDAGREGELIFRRIMQVAGYEGPVRRLWISSYTDEAIQGGFRDLRPGEEYEPLYESARVRSEGDWIVGINGTRALSVRHGGPVSLSVGRVQTPVLAGIVRREQEIRSFVPEPFWFVKATFAQQAGTRYEGLWFRPDHEDADSDEPEKPKGKGREEGADKGRASISRASWIASEEEAQALIARMEGATGRVLEARRKTRVERPPQLFDLTSLQRAAHGRYRMTAKDTLQVAQSLYEKHKLLTYPRTDSRYISQDIVPSLRRRVEMLRGCGLREHAEALLERGFKADRRVVDDGKVTDHHAILVTEVDPGRRSLSRVEARIYELVGRQMVAALSPAARWEDTRVVTGVDEERFVTRGKVLRVGGWREVIPPRGGDRPLPVIEDGEEVEVAATELGEDQTRPPPRYSEGSLLKFMETAGREIHEAELREAMKEQGLGTPATRAEIIEKLKRRSYIEADGKVLRPTPLGEVLVELIPIEELTSAELTGVWEKRIREVQRREYDPEAFRREIVALTDRFVAAVKGAPSRSEAVREAAPEAAVRRWEERRQKSASRGRARSGSSRGEGNGRASSGRASSGRASSGRASSGRASSGQAERSTGARGSGKAGVKARKAKGKASKAASAGSSKSAKAVGTPLGSCPRCRQGTVIVGQRDFGCSRWREGCRYVLPKSAPGGRSLTQAQVKSLLEKGQTRPLTFEGQRGKYKGRFKLEGERVVVERG